LLRNGYASNSGFISNDLNVPTATTNSPIRTVATISSFKVNQIHSREAVIYHSNGMNFIKKS
jgi:hypothetical protein